MIMMDFVFSKERRQKMIIFLVTEEWFTFNLNSIYIQLNIHLNPEILPKELIYTILYFNWNDNST